MENVIATIAPAGSNGTSKKNPSDFNLTKNFFKNVFSQVLAQGEVYLDKLTVTKNPANAELMQDINTRMRALLATGLFTKEKLIDAQSKTQDKELQKLMVRAWVTSDTPPTKQVCVELMNAFAKEKAYLTATVILCRNDDFPFFNIATFLIDNIGEPLSMDLVRVLEENQEELKNRKAK